MCLCLLSLYGCASAPKEADVRADFAALEGVSFHAKIFSDTATLALEYELDYVYNKTDSDTLTITAPEVLSGVSMTISGKQKDELTLQYAGTELDLPSAAQPGMTPADCIPALLCTLRDAVPTETASESQNGVPLTMLQYEDIARNGTCRQIWLTRDTHILICAEFYADGQRVLHCTFSDWKPLTGQTATSK